MCVALPSVYVPVRHAVITESAHVTLYWAVWCMHAWIKFKIYTVICMYQANVYNGRHIQT